VQGVRYLLAIEERLEFGGGAGLHLGAGLVGDEGELRELLVAVVRPARFRACSAESRILE
jgi:hypothetical protein